MKTKNDISVSVCIATYNGEKFILDQLNSIIIQIDKNDEIIIVDDGSNDMTVDLIKSIKDDRIKLIINEINLGVNRSFELALSVAQNCIIALADQDDIWTVNRLDIIKKHFASDFKTSLIAGNSEYINTKFESVQTLIGHLDIKDSNRPFLNLWKIFSGKAPYYGCAMALRKDFKNLILPFPSYIESHDLWIAKCAIITNSMFHIEEPLLFRRIHGNNASVIKRSLGLKIRSRIIFLLSILAILIRKYRRSYASFVK